MDYVFLYLFLINSSLISAFLNLFKLNLSQNYLSNQFDLSAYFSFATINVLIVKLKTKVILYLHQCYKLSVLVLDQKIATLQYEPKLLKECELQYY